MRAFRAGAGCADLIAEDEPFLARALAAGLRQQSLAVDVAADGAQALERLAAIAFDGVVSVSEHIAYRTDDARRSPTGT
ncbi:hypothetical protein ACFU8W_32765 [Streptomyces sp. NPDC057565]|uniref:hypothetical protein n=1 Tax=Streptomyces sp. NPDC057565 TaxID=3346169 RepID=UPI00367B98E1